MKKVFCLVGMIFFLCLFFTRCVNNDHRKNVENLRRKFEKPKSKPKVFPKPEVKQERTMQCSVCNGSGYTVCMMCSGLGTQLQPQVNYYTNSIYYIQVACTFCNGQGKTICTYCGGKGIVTLPSGNIPPTPYIPPVTDNPRIQSGKKLVRKTCTFCNGSGKNPAKEYGPDYTGGREITIDYCPICNTSGRSHYHTSCPSCLGRGYNEVYE